MRIAYPLHPRLDFVSLILLLKLDQQFPVEQFEATVSQSTVPSPPLVCVTVWPVRRPPDCAWFTKLRMGEIRGARPEHILISKG